MPLNNNFCSLGFHGLLGYAGLLVPTDVGQGRVSNAAVFR